MDSMIKKVGEFGVIPVIKINRVEDAVPLATALSKGGLPVAEITFRTAAAKGAIKAITEALPDMLVGAGTVLTKQQVDDAIEAGSKFIVSPGLNPEIVKYCQSKGVPMLPGCSNPSDIECALELGLDAVKFFPAEAAGGLAMLKAMAAPYGNVMFMPTGGINEKNLESYLAFDKIIACGGTFMIDEKAIAEGNFGVIEEKTRKAVTAMLGFELGHIGINGDNEEEAIKAAKMFETLFGFTAKIGNSSVFADKYIEVMKAPFRGKYGHIAIATNHISRAVAYLERNGVEMDYSTVKKDEKGNYPAIYLKEEIAGFAIHLLQKK